LVAHDLLLDRAEDRAAGVVQQVDPDAIAELQKLAIHKAQEA
jgi:hypothetical protein